MFFNAKKLITQKEQLNDKIQAEYKRMDVAYQQLKKALEEFYGGYQYFDNFDITVVDFWFGDIACCYAGKNYDLSNAFFRMSNQLESVEAENITNEQLVGIYNIFTILFNDMYAGEEPILIQSDLTRPSLLDKFNILSKKLISCLRNDHSASAPGLCEAVEKLYTLLDFSLGDTIVHQQLRQLKAQHLEDQTTGYDNIDRYRNEIEEIDRRLEKHNRSEDGKKVSRKEIDPFPTLKAYNNAMKLLGCCLLAVEQYEKEGDIFAPSCVDEISDLLLERFIRAKDAFDEWDETVNYEKVAHTMLANATFDMLASGRYHLYTGILNPLNCSANLMLVYDKSMAYGVKIGMITKEEKKEQREYLLKRISEVG